MRSSSPAVADQVRICTQRQIRKEDVGRQYGRGARAKKNSSPPNQRGEEIKRLSNSTGTIFEMEEAVPPLLGGISCYHPGAQAHDFPRSSNYMGDWFQIAKSIHCKVLKVKENYGAK